MVRVKHRYFLVEILSEKYPLSQGPLQFPLRPNLLIRAIRDVVEMLHGDYGIGIVQCGLDVKMYNAYTRIAVIRARRGDAHRMLGSSLPFVHKINDIPVYLRVLHLAGSIRLCLKFLQRYHRQQINVLLRRCMTEKEKMDAKIAIRNSEMTLGLKVNEHHDDDQDIKDIALACFGTESTTKQKQAAS